MADTGQCHLRVAKTLLNYYSIKFTIWNLPCTYPCLWVCVCARILYVMMHELQKYWFMEHRVTAQLYWHVSLRQKRGGNRGISNSKLSKHASSASWKSHWDLRCVWWWFLSSSLSYYTTYFTVVCLQVSDLVQTAKFSGIYNRLSIRSLDALDNRYHGAKGRMWNLSLIFTARAMLALQTLY